MRGTAAKNVFGPAGKKIIAGAADNPNSGKAAIPTDGKKKKWSAPSLPPMKSKCCSEVIANCSKRVGSCRNPFNVS